MQSESCRETFLETGEFSWSRGGRPAARTSNPPPRRKRLPARARLNLGGAEGALRSH